MAECKVVSGLTSTTKENLVLDAGAFFKNYNVVSPDEGVTPADTFDTAVAAGKLLGATKGGGSFSAVPTFRDIEVDGVRGAWKGGKILESWEVTMGVSLVEVKSETLKDALGVATIDSSDATYEKITGNACVLDTDYIDNITWVGNISGKNELAVIQVYNALNTKGIEFSFEDKSEAVLELEFVGHYDGDSTTPPFAIYYPKTVA